MCKSRKTRLTYELGKSSMKGGRVERVGGRWVDGRRNTRRINFIC